jgi:WD40 repeat protein
VTAKQAASERRDCPYFGLDFYDEECGDWFFGRDPECDRIITNLRGARLTLLHADSGVGKSSLLRAGVAARLATTADLSLARRGRARFVPVVFSAWKDEPVAGLIKAIATAVERFTPAGSAPELSRESSLTDAIVVAAAAIDGTLLLILDQFEEYFVYTAAEPTRGRFANELSRVINDTELPAHVLISIREDGYAGLGDLFKGRLANVYGNYLDVAYLDRASAAEAIRRPLLEVYNRQPDVEPVEIEPQLVEAVLDQVRAGGEPVPGQPPVAGTDGASDDHVATPVLQLVMEAIWRQERREGSPVLRLVTLERLEGVAHILDAHLADALGALTEDQRHVALDAFDHLVTPSGGKIAESIPDLAARTSQPEAGLGEVLIALDRARILRPVPAPPGRDPVRFRRYEIFHDVLAPAINRAIATRAEERLERERNEAVERVRLERRRVHRAQLLAAIACVLLVVAVVGVVYALHQRQHAVDDQHSAQSAEGAASAQQLLGSDPQLATAVALRALQLHRSPAAEAALRAAVPLLQLRRTLTLPAPVEAVAYSPDGSTIAVANSAGTVELLNARTRRRLASFGGRSNATLRTMSFDPDGRLIATGYGDGTVRIWSVGDRKEVGGPLAVDPGYAVRRICFDPDGTKLAVAADTDARIFDLRTRTALLVIHDPGYQLVDDVDWSPSGAELLTAGASGTAHLWNATTGAQLKPALNHGVYLDSARFSRNGNRIVTAANDGTADVWNAQTHRRIDRLRSPAALVGAVFSPNGRSIATMDDNGTTQIWPADNGSSAPAALRPPGQLSPPMALAYSPDGRSLVIGGADGRVRIWDTRSYHQLAVLPRLGGANPATSVSYSGDGHWLLAGSAGGTAREWNAATGQVRVTVASPDKDAINAVSVTNHGERFLTANADGHAYEWDPRTAKITGTISDPQARAFDSIEYDPIDPHLVLTAAAYDYARVWSLPSGRPFRTILIPPAKGVDGAAFNEDGSLVLTSTINGVVRAWRNVGGFSFGPLGLVPYALPVGSTIKAGGRSTGHTAAFDPSGTLAVVAGDAGTARVWSIASGREIGQPMTEPGNASINDVHFVTEGYRVLTASSDGTARIWDWATGQQLVALVGDGGPLRAAVLSPGGAEVATAGGDGAVRVWDARPSEQVGPGIFEPGGGGLFSSFFDPAGAKVVTAGPDGIARVWSVTDQRELDRPLREPHKHELVSAVFDPTGTHVLTASHDGAARSWNVRTGRVERTFGKPGAGELADAVYSPDGRYVLLAYQVDSGQDPGTTQVYDVRTGNRIGRPIRDPNDQSMTWAAFSADGSEIVTADVSGTAYLWSARPNADGKYREIGAPLTEPGGQPLGRVWFDPSPHSPLLVTSSTDGTARVWNRNTGTQLGVIAEPGHSPIWNAALGPNGWLLTASGDGTARIWNWRTGQQLTEFAVGDHVYDAEFSRDGKFVTTASAGGAAQIFSTALAGPTSTVESIARRRDPMRLTAAQVRAYLH